MFWLLFCSLGTTDIIIDEDTLPLNETEAQVITGSSERPRRPSTSQAAAATLTEAGKALEGSEAELVLLPLRLAFETKQAKIIEPALDCLHVSARDLITLRVLCCSPLYSLWFSSALALYLTLKTRTLLLHTESAFAESNSIIRRN